MKLWKFTLSLWTVLVLGSTPALAASANKASDWLPPVLLYILDAQSIDVTKPKDILVEQHGEVTTIQWDATSHHWYKVQKAVNGGAYGSTMTMPDSEFTLSNTDEGRVKYRIAACLNNSDSCSDWVQVEKTFGRIPAPESQTIEAQIQNATINITSSHHDFYPIQYKVEFKRNQDDWQTYSLSPNKQIAFTPALSGEYTVRTSICVMESELVCSSPASDSLPFPITIMPTAPFVTLTAEPVNKYTLTWDPVVNATNYRVDIYQADSGLKHLRRDIITETQFSVNDTLPRGSIIYFAIYACTDIAFFCSDISNELRVETIKHSKPQPPTITKFHHQAHNHILIEWSAVEGAAYYRYNVQDHGTEVIDYFTYNTTVTFPGNLPVGNLLDFKIQSCNEDHICSEYSETKSTTILPYADSLPPRPVSLETEDIRLVEGQRQRFGWRMQEGYSKPVTFSFYETKQGQESKLIQAGIKEYLFEHVIENSGEVTFEVQACHAELGCGPKKPLTKQVDVAPNFVITLNRLAVYVGEEITVSYSIPSPYACSAHGASETLSQTGNKTVTFIEPNEGTLTWNCTDGFGRNIVVKQTLHVRFKPLTVPEGSIEFALSTTKTTVAQPVTLDWRIIAGITCKSNLLNREFSNSGSMQLMYVTPEEMNILIHCQNANNEGMQITLPLSIQKLPAPILRRDTAT
ncbi:hypothetical protein OE749_01675 [Aestuariibacter sp. AA17]|uniref:Fibronectin type-III domain-containing protein n=1 Tax=Fluctibacter corallii TaxID=2984329 RepID=A0ABT3A416_9ALTE|nr:hypothetical protein [Aestuariibacter sp. AA17]MCV2883406.1 hypothetical protein [Aestuariibacter sp. AA17]